MITIKTPFINQNYKQDTKLSKDIWTPRDHNQTFHIEWSVYTKLSDSNLVSICLLNADKSILMNKRVDLVSSEDIKTNTYLLIALEQYDP